MTRTDSLEEDLCAVAGHLNAQHARLVDLTIRLLADPSSWSGPGVWRAEQYLCWKVALAPRRAKQIVQIAERASELPESMDAFRRGLLSIDQMTAIALKAPWWTDKEICSLGRRMTVRQLRNVLAKYPFPDIPKPDESTDVDAAAGAGGDADPVAPGDGSIGTDVDAAAGDAVSGVAEPAAVPVEPPDRWLAYFDESGRYHLSLETDHVTGKIIDGALGEARDKLFRNGRSDVTWVESLCEVAQRSLDSIDEPARRNRFRINFHLDVHGAAVDGTGVRIPDAVKQHLTCDGSWNPVFIDEGFPVSVGRSKYIVPDRTRRLVLLRDQGCRVPGCTQTHVVEIHHIVHWDDGGPTDTWNLVSLCPQHHRLHHQGRLGISGNADDPDGLVFTNGAGTRIPQSGARPTPPGAPPPPPIGTYRHPLGERLDARWLYFNPPPEHRQRVTPESLAADHWGKRSPLVR